MSLFKQFIILGILSVSTIVFAADVAAELPRIRANFYYKNVELRQLPKTVFVNEKAISPLAQFLTLYYSSETPSLPRRLARRLDTVKHLIKSGEERKGLLAWRDLVASTWVYSDAIDIEQLISNVLLAVTKDGEEDLKAIMAETKSLLVQKKALRDEIESMKDIMRHCRDSNTCADDGPQGLEDTIAKLADQLDSLSELSEASQLKLQSAMERRSKLMETLSNLLKKMQETSENIIRNLK